MKIENLVPHQEYKVFHGVERIARFNGIRWYGKKYTLDMEFSDTKQYNPFSIHQWEIEQNEIVISEIN